MKSNTREARLKFAEEMQKIHPALQFDPEEYGEAVFDAQQGNISWEDFIMKYGGKAERLQDLQSIGDTRARDRWQDNHEAQSKYSDMAPPFSEMHISFYDEVKAYADSKDIDLHVGSAPAGLFFTRDYKQRFAVQHRTKVFDVDTSLPESNQGRMLAYEMMKYLDKLPETDFMSLYVISRRERNKIAVRFSTVNTKEFV